VPVTVKVDDGPPATPKALDGATVNDVSARNVPVTELSAFRVNVQTALKPHADAPPVLDE
jgi:hypothetical protein